MNEPEAVRCAVMSSMHVVLAVVPNSRVGSGSSSTWNRTVGIGLTTRKTRNTENGLVSPSKTRHFKFTILAPKKILSSDHTMTWSIRRLYSVRRSFSSRCQICDQTNMNWVAIENPRIWHSIWCYFTMIPRILVQSQIWKRKVEELLTLHNLHSDHATIQSELGYLIGGKDAGWVRWNCGPVHTQPKNCRFKSSPHNDYCKQRFQLGCSVPGLGWNRTGTVQTGFTPRNNRTALNPQIFGRFHNFTNSEFWLPLTIWVLIVSQYDIFI